MMQEWLKTIAVIVIIGVIIVGVTVFLTNSTIAQESFASEMVHSYSSMHTYMPNNSFTCSDMAIDLWDMMKTEDLDAYIAIGNLDSNERPTLLNSTHAWVIVIFKENAIAYEPQTGETIHQNDDIRYFNAFLLDDPAKVKEFYALYGDYNRTSRLYEVSKESYEATEKRYYANASEMTLDMNYVNARATLESQYAVYKERENDLMSILTAIETMDKTLPRIQGGKL